MTLAVPPCRSMALTVCSLSLFLAGVRANEAGPLPGYERRTVEGFTVLVHADVLKHEADAANAFRELEGQLKKIVALMPDCASISSAG